MRSREIVRRTLEFDRPERVAASFPEPYWHDVCHVHYDLVGYHPVWRDVGGGWQQYVDEWGNTWARLDRTSKGEAIHGVLEDWAHLDDLRLPDLANPANFAAVRAACGNPRQIACGVCAEAVRVTMFRMTLMKPMPSISPWCVLK